MGLSSPTIPAPAIYDLSWLNPTPHAIAVYASQPLSPVATQHSLPSGRYSLLGPDLHRLDRTSFRLAHLFDHLVGGASIWALQARAERSRADSQIRLVWHRTHRTPWPWPSHARCPPHTRTCR